MEDELSQLKAQYDKLVSQFKEMSNTASHRVHIMENEMREIEKRVSQWDKSSSNIKKDVEELKGKLEKIESDLKEVLTLFKLISSKIGINKQINK